MLVAINIVIRKVYFKFKRRIRNFVNPYLAPYRRNKLVRFGISSDFTIISNNCWAGLVYQYFGLPYNTPTAGLFFFAQDYIKFVYKFKDYLKKDLQFIPHEASQCHDILLSYGGECVSCPIAKCGDIEIIFMHYHTAEEANENGNEELNV